MPAAKPVNPFYFALLPVGVVFAITACCYMVMAYRGLNPRQAEEGGLIALMDQHGLTIMAVEIVLLAVLTFAAIGTDDYWTRRAEAGQGTGVGGQGTGVGSRESEVENQESVETRHES